MLKKFGNEFLINKNDVTPNIPVYISVDRRFFSTEIVRMISYFSVESMRCDVTFVQIRSRKHLWRPLLYALLEHG